MFCLFVLALFLVFQHGHVLKTQQFQNLLRPKGMFEEKSFHCAMPARFNLIVPFLNVGDARGVTI